MQNPFAIIDERLGGIQEQVKQLQSMQNGLLDAVQSKSDGLEQYRYVSAAEAATIVSVHKNTIHNWHKSGYIRKFTIDGNSRYKLAELLAFVENNEV